MKGLIQTDRNNPETWRGLANALFAAGDNNTAEKCRVKANEIEIEMTNELTITVINPLATKGEITNINESVTTHKQSDSDVNQTGMMKQMNYSQDRKSPGLHLNLT